MIAVYKKFFLMLGVTVLLCLSVSFAYSEENIFFCKIKTNYIVRYDKTFESSTTEDYLIKKTKDFLEFKVVDNITNWKKKFKIKHQFTKIHSKERYTDFYSDYIENYILLEDESFLVSFFQNPSKSSYALNVTSSSGHTGSKVRIYSCNKTTF